MGVIMNALYSLSQYNIEIRTGKCYNLNCPLMAEQAAARGHLAVKTATLDMSN